MTAATRSHSNKRISNHATRAPVVWWRSTQSPASVSGDGMSIRQLSSSARWRGCSGKRYLSRQHLLVPSKPQADSSAASSINPGFGSALVAAASGALLGYAFVVAFEKACWGDEHAGSEFRYPHDANIFAGKSLQDGRELSPTLWALTEDQEIYESASGIPEGVVGDIWKALNPNVIVLEEENEPIQRMLAQLRDHRVVGEKFVFYANRLWMLLVEQALCEIDDSEEAIVVTPSGHLYKGNFLSEHTKLCGISVQTNIVDSNTKALNSLLGSLQALLNNEGCNLSHFGEIIVEKKSTQEAGDGSQLSTGFASKTTTARVSKSTLPSDLSSRYALLVHPTLSTGTSIKLAVDHLVSEKGVDQRRIVVLVLLSCPSSIEAMNAAFPDVRIVTAGLDRGLDPKTGRIYPGIGDFGRRYAPGCQLVLESQEDPASHSSSRAWNGQVGETKRYLKRRKTRRALANKRKA